MFKRNDQRPERVVQAQQAASVPLKHARIASPCLPFLNPLSSAITCSRGITAAQNTTEGLAGAAPLPGTPRRSVAGVPACRAHPPRVLLLSVHPQGGAGRLGGLALLVVHVRLQRGRMAVSHKAGNWCSGNHHSERPSADHAARRSATPVPSTQLVQHNKVKVTELSRCTHQVALAAVHAVEVGGHEDARAALGAHLAQALHLAAVVHLVELEHPQLHLLVPGRGRV